MSYFGTLAALGAAFCWASSAICFTFSGKRIGAFATNHYRVLWATLFLALMHLVMFKTLWPGNIQLWQFAFIFFSGFVGIVVGDTCLFQAYIDIGPRLGLLVFSSYPLITVLLSWPILKEKLSLISWVGFSIALVGILWVVREKKADGLKNEQRNYVRGVLFGMAAAVCQALGLIIVKPVLSGSAGVDTLSATLIRLLSAAVVMWLIDTFRGKISGIISHVKDIRAMGFVLAGSIIGPFIGMWLLHIALKLSPAGVTAILMATTPIMILPIVVIAYREKVSWRAILGAVVAFTGIAILLLGG